MKFRRRLNRWCMHMFCSLRSDFLISNLWNSRVISGCLNFDMLASKQRSIFYECGLDKMRSRRRHLIWITTMLSTHTQAAATKTLGAHTHGMPPKRDQLPPEIRWVRNVFFQELPYVPSIRPSIHLPDAQLRRVKFMGNGVVESEMKMRMSSKMKVGATELVCW